MKIELSEEYIIQIRRIVRQEIQKFWHDANKELSDKIFKDEVERLK